MANRTHTSARNVHGTDPQHLVEKIVRGRIQSNMYWKEHCFGLAEDGVVEKAVELEAVGGTYGPYRKPTRFLCLVLKLLQLQPSLDTVIEFIEQGDYKYARVLGAFYLRLVGSPLQIYEYLEPLLNDYRKIRLRNIDSSYTITYVDELVDRFLNESDIFDCTIPRIPPRRILEINYDLQPRISTVTTNEVNNDDDDDDDESDEEEPVALPPPKEKRRRSSSEESEGDNQTKRIDA